MGNSEVGHLNIGAGRIVHQELTRINRACRTGSIDENEVINACLDSSKEPGRALHVMGLLSDGGVHSSNEHLFAILEHAVSRGLEDIRVHCFLDGRDVPPSSGEGYVAELERLIASKGWGRRVRIASICGRYYAMDRDQALGPRAKGVGGNRLRDAFCRLRGVRRGVRLVRRWRNG